MQQGDDRAAGASAQPRRLDRGALAGTDLAARVLPVAVQAVQAGEACVRPLRHAVDQLHAGHRCDAGAVGGTQGRRQVAGSQEAISADRRIGRGAGVGLRVGRGQRTPQVQRQVDAGQLQRLGCEAQRQQPVAGRFRGGVGIAGGGEGGTAQRGGRRQRRRGHEGRQTGQCGGRAGLIQRRFQPVGIQRHAAGDRHVRRPGDHRVENAAVVQLGGFQQRRRAVADRHAEDRGVLRRERRLRREGQIQRVQAEGHRLQRVAAPVGFRMVLRVGVLHRQALARQAGVEVQRRAAARGGAAVQTDADPAGQIEDAGAGALVGVDHRAAARQAEQPAHRDRPVNTARTGSRRDHQTAARGVEGVGDLRQHPVRLPRAGQAGKGAVFAAGHRIETAVPRAEATGRRQVGDPAPVGVDGAAPQRGDVGIGRGGR